MEAAREATQNGDYKKAFDIYKSLANAGNAEAQYCLGIMYETGKGVDIDIFEAVMWYRKAKAKGFSMAERVVGARLQLEIKFLFIYYKNISGYERKGFFFFARFVSGSSENPF